MQSELPQILFGPLMLYYDNCFEKIIINDKEYNYDRHGNITGYKHCLLLIDSNCDLEEIGFWDPDNKCIIDYHFGYSYL